MWFKNFGEKIIELILSLIVGLVGGVILCVTYTFIALLLLTIVLFGTPVGWIILILTAIKLLFF